MLRVKSEVNTRTEHLPEMATSLMRTNYLSDYLDRKTTVMGFESKLLTEQHRFVFFVSIFLD